MQTIQLIKDGRGTLGLLSVGSLQRRHQIQCQTPNLVLWENSHYSFIQIKSKQLVLFFR